jgi:hypothetical protein
VGSTEPISRAQAFHSILSMRSANVLDSGRAAIGAPVTAFTGKTPNWLEPNPDDQGALIQAIGGVVLLAEWGGASRAQEVANASMGALRAGASKVVADVTGNPSRLQPVLRRLRSQQAAVTRTTAGKGQ